MEELIKAIGIMLTACAFTPSTASRRTWVKPAGRAYPTQPLYLVYVHPRAAATVRLTLWEGTKATRLTPHGTYAVATEVEFVDLLADCGWLN